MLALVVALLAAGRLLTLPEPAAGQRSSAPAGAVTLAAAWPEARVSSQSGTLSDGTVFTPALYLDAQTVVGLAPAPGGTFVRVLVRTGAGVTELRRVRADRYPRWSGFVAQGDTLVWAETTSRDEDTVVRTGIWRANWRTGGDARLLTTDTGDAIFFQSQYDLVIAEDRVHWVGVEFNKVAITQVRSVPLAGGRVDVRRVVGPYALTQWPWLTSVSNGQSIPVQLHNLKTGKRIKIPSGPAEVPKCGVSWCRVVVVGPTGMVRLDLVHPDGSARRRVAGAGTTPVLNDVALLDRFEPLAQDPPVPPGVDEAAVPARQLALYDISTGRTVVVHTDVATVAGHGGMLWWSQGREDAYTWFALDLRGLT
jgi:hypothetical protein